jgi:hypothetical protein
MRLGPPHEPCRGLVVHADPRADSIAPGSDNPRETATAQLVTRMPAMLCADWFLGSTPTRVYLDPTSLFLLPNGGV